MWGRGAIGAVLGLLVCKVVMYPSQQGGARRLCLQGFTAWSNAGGAIRHSVCLIVVSSLRSKSIQDALEAALAIGIAACILRSDIIGEPSATATE